MPRVIWRAQGLVAGGLEEAGAVDLIIYQVPIWMFDIILPGLLVRPVVTSSNQWRQGEVFQCVRVGCGQWQSVRCSNASNQVEQVCDYTNYSEWNN